MPLYEYLCDCCETRQTRFLALNHYRDPQYCDNPSCGQFVAEGSGLNVSHPQTPLVKLVSAPAVHGDYPGYVSPASGKWVEGRKAHLEDLKATGCRIFEPGERQQEIQKAKDREEALGKQIDQAVEQTAAQLGIGN